MTGRVLVVTNMWPRAGDPSFGVFVRDQVEVVRGLGVPCDVHFVDGRAATRNYALSLPALRRRLRRDPPDVLHAHHVLAGWVAWLARGARPDPPLVVTHHGIEVFERWQAPLCRWLTRRVERSLVVSKAMARRLGLDEHADVLPMGVDLARFHPGDRAAARRALGLPSDRPLVAWVGADRPEKRLWLARAALERLRSTGSSAELMVVADRPHEEVPSWLRAADALLLTSTREGAPVVVKEALACDRPVVSTAVGDVPELIGDLPGCAVVAPEPDALAEGLRRALAHGPVAGRAVVAPFTTQRLAARLVAIYDEVVAARRGEDRCGS